MRSYTIETKLPKYNQYGLTFNGYPTRNCTTCPWKSNCNGSPCGVKTIKKASDASLHDSSSGVGLSTTSGSASKKISLTEPLPLGEKKPMAPSILSLLRYKAGYWICTDGMKYIKQLPAYIHQSQIGYNFQGSAETPVKPSPSPTPEPSPEPSPESTPESTPEPTPEPTPKRHSSFRDAGLIDKNYMQQHKIQTYRLF